MGTLYDNVTASVRTIEYTSATPSVTYPDAGIYNVLGVTFAPRVYAKDLSALELASSGRISATLNDAFAFDISESNSEVRLQTREDAGWLLANGSGGAFLDLHSNDAFQLVGAGSCAIVGDDVALTGSNSLTMRGGVASLTLSDDLTFEAESLGFSASSNLTFTACNQMSLTTGPTGSNRLFMDGSSGEVTLISDSNLLLQTSNEGPSLELDAASNRVTVSGTIVEALAADALLLSSSNTLTLSSSNDLQARVARDAEFLVGSNLAVSVGDSNVLLRLSSNDASAVLSAT